MENRKWYELDSCTLHILAMGLMVVDHLWGTLAGNIRILTSIGRLCFPIFAFLIVEGYFHTSNLKKYKLRLFVLALLSEIPFDWMMSGNWFGIFHQNVIWSFLIAIYLMQFVDWMKKKLENKNVYVRVIVFYVIAYLVCVIGNILGIVTMVDYFGGGIVMVLLFYIFHERNWWNCLFLIICMYYVNVEILGSLVYEWNVFSITISIVEQSFALLSLIPIWLYKGRQGYHSKWFQLFCYGFYPLHMILLCLLRG